MQPIKIIEIPKEQAPQIDKFLIDNGAVYFIAFENDMETRASILFKNLKWVANYYGKDNIITKESLNENRIFEIEQYKKALRHNVPIFELEKIDDEGNVRIDPEIGKPYHLLELSEIGRNTFQNNIDRGLYVLCKYV